MQKKITKRVVDATISTNMDQVIWDTELKGFGLRCRANGGKFYVLKFRASGRQRWATIGRHGSPWAPESARKEAQKLLYQIAGGMDLSTDKDRTPKTLTVAHLADRYLTEHVKVKTRPRTENEYRRLLEKFILPDMGCFQIPDVTRTDIIRLHNRHRKTPYQANRLLAVLSKMFNLSESWGYIPNNSNPCLGVEKFKEKKRNRFLNDQEMRRLGNALSKAEDEKLTSPSCIAAIRLLIHTGCRLNEILTLRWDNVDSNHAEFRLSDDNLGSKTIQLTPEAAEVINNIPQVQGNPFVIIGERRKKHLVNLQKPWRKIRKIAQLDDLRLNDLRHSYASITAVSGLGLPIIGALLGYSYAPTAHRHAHWTTNPLKKGNYLFANKVSNALGKSKSSLVAGKKRRHD